jgi:hypothetical protein
MRKRFRIGLTLACLFAFGAAGYYYNRYSKEPSFEGKSLSEWVLTMHAKQAGPEQEEARTVVRQLGSKSIPLLLHWLREGDSPSLDERIYDLKSSVFGWLAAHHIIKPRSVTIIGFHLNHRTVAGLALAELEPTDKKAVIPVLIQMLGDKKHKSDEMSGGISVLAGNAFTALPLLAPESIAPLIDALSSQDFQVWVLAKGALGNIGPEAKAAIPALEKRLRDKDPKIRVGAAETIGELGGDPNEFVPIIIQSLPELDSDDLDETLDILLHYKEHAKPAVPVLLTILSNTPVSASKTNTFTRVEVINALQQIDPDAATKAGVK